MSAGGFIPTPQEFVREAIIIIGGSVLAVLVFNALPEFKAWVLAGLPSKQNAPVP